jgi:hypothetical protein
VTVVPHHGLKVSFAALLLLHASMGVNFAQDHALFLVSNGPPNQSFIIRLDDPQRIMEARAIVAGTERTRVHIGGIVVKAQASYNPRWHFHLDPRSVSFFEAAIEVCDAATSHVEEHLDEVGGAFLPGNRWCPWPSIVTRELK